MRVFGDSFYFIALLHEDDAHHAAVSHYAHEHRAKVFTTRWVLAEVANALCEPALRRHVTAFLAHAAVHPSVVILRESDALFEHGLALYDARPDKYWSLTDCISFVVMEQEKLREALTRDRHFEQAGFVAVFAE